jgi:hypothetical protein
MPTIIDMKGVWSAARNTQAEIQEVNRPGYQGAPRVAEETPLGRRAPSKQTAHKAE